MPFKTLAIVVEIIVSFNGYRSCNSCLIVSSVIAGFELTIFSIASRISWYTLVDLSLLPPRGTATTPPLLIALKRKIRPNEA